MHVLNTHLATYIAFGESLIARGLVQRPDGQVGISIVIGMLAVKVEKEGYPRNPGRCIACKPGRGRDDDATPRRRTVGVPSRFLFFCFCLLFFLFFTRK